MVNADLCSCVIFVFIFVSIVRPEFLALTVQLEKQDWGVDEYNNNHEDVDGHLQDLDVRWWSKYLGVKKGDKGNERVGQERQEVDEEAAEEKDKILVVTVANTVVDERAVMVKALDAPVTVVAVAGLLWSEILALDAEIVEMKRVVEHLLKDLNEVISAGHVAWVDQGQAVEQDCQ